MPLVSGNEATIAWTDFHSTDDSIFVTTGATPTAVNLEVPGTYHVSAYYDFGSGIGFDDGDLYWIAVNDLWGSADVLYLDRSGWAQLGDTIGLAWTRTYPPHGETVTPTGAVAIIRVDAGQITGVANTIYPRLEIAFMGRLHPEIEPYS